jgi:hypothetical protein
METAPDWGEGMENRKKGNPGASLFQSSVSVSRGILDGSKGKKEKRKRHGCVAVIDDLSSPKLNCILYRVTGQRSI